MKSQPVSSIVSKYYPALDPLRGFAVLLVFLCHYGRHLPGERLTYWGWIGVDIFFVLSGFLITGILFDSVGEPDFFRKFYIRRSLRILPLFYAFWLVLLALTPVFQISWNRYVALHAIFLGNFFTTPLTSFLHFQRPHTPFRILVVGHFWSLDIEEQFYLLWPLVIFFVRDRVKLMRACIAGITYVLTLRVAVFFFFPAVTHDTNLLYNATPFRCDALLMGCWAALWLRGSSLSIATLRKRCWTVGLSCVAILLASEAVCLAFFPASAASLDNIPWLETYGYTFIDAAVLCFLFACLQPGTWIYRTLMVSRLKALGRVSFGFYIFHNLPYNSFFKHQPQMAAHHLQIPATIALFFACYGLSWLSFTFLETPFRNLKETLAPKNPESLSYSDPSGISAFPA